MEIKVEIKNMAQVQKALAKSPGIVSKYIDQAIKKSVFEIEREAKPRTPVDTGRLRQSYEISFGRLRGEIYPTADYAIFVHEGTRFMRARPYLAEGVGAAMDNINNHFERELEGALNQIVREAR